MTGQEHTGVCERCMLAPPGAGGKACSPWRRVAAHGPPCALLLCIDPVLYRAVWLSSQWPWTDRAQGIEPKRTHKKAPGFAGMHLMMRSAHEWQQYAPAQVCSHPLSSDLAEQRIPGVPLTPLTACPGCSARRARRWCCSPFSRAHFLRQCPLGAAFLGRLWRGPRGSPRLRRQSPPTCTFRIPCFRAGCCVFGRTW
jgi:hypothetical protein